MRGYLVSNFYSPAIAYVFDADARDVEVIGDDNLSSIDTFARTPKADLEVFGADGRPATKVEMQSGYTGINQVKLHKVNEARNVFAGSGASSVAAHFDFFNGEVALVPLNFVADEDQNWTVSQQMEGQKVLNIDPRFFVWDIREMPPKWASIEKELTGK